jgi:hypothetical protein
MNYLPSNDDNLTSATSLNWNGTSVTIYPDCVCSPKPSGLRSLPDLTLAFSLINEVTEDQSIISWARKAVINSLWIYLPISLPVFASLTIQVRVNIHEGGH